MRILAIGKSPNAIDLSFTQHKMVVFLEDGRELAVPLEWLPALRDATSEQLNKWRLIGNGEGVHWVELDEDILVERLLG